MPPIFRSVSLLALLAIAVAGIGMALPLIRYLCERPEFFGISLVSAVAVSLLLVTAPLRARVDRRRKLIFFGAAAGVTLVEAANIYFDFGAPPLWTTSPDVLAVFREMVHILLFGFLAFAASRLLRTDLGGAALTLTAFTYAFMVGIADETVQWGSTPSGWATSETCT